MSLDNYSRLPEIKEANSLSELAEILGLSETTIMKELRENIVGAMINNEEYLENLKKYEKLSIERIEKFKGDKYEKAQIGYLLLEANIHLKAEIDEEKYNELIDQALDYAHNAGLTEIEMKIEELA